MAGKIESTGMDNDKQYPEVDKFDEHIDKIHAIEEFLEFMQEKNYVLTDLDAEVIMGSGIRGMIHKFYGIDGKKLEKERRAMLEAYDDVAPLPGDGWEVNGDIV